MTDTLTIQVSNLSLGGVRGMEVTRSLTVKVLNVSMPKIIVQQEVI